MFPILPTPIAKYFEAKNLHAIDAMLATFSDLASVCDEGQEMVGHLAIRNWMEETTRKYRVTVTPTGVDQSDAKTIVTALVSGTFPGSPAQLRYHFTVAGEQITHLAIG
ncbi:MAG: hypothetical protein A3D94_02630 [Alphaproteobacteria bacterium RIFCSPHIGHO2_12_FULL_66_14]|nr:MAG: hypothetical protein A3D94_02630 [Alphaproteobacteria bacterium RIFCSPHIGHO2_12_FULL_66_14]